MSDQRATAVAVVPAGLDGVRADRILAVIAGISRAAAAELIDSGGVKVGETAVARNTRLATGTALEYPRTGETEQLIPEKIAFDVVFEDPEIIVVDKPAGLVVHPGAGNLTGTLANGLIQRYPDLAVLGREHRWGLVHRLDRETSGLLLVARTAVAHRFLQGELKQRRIHRRYLALVAGELGAATGTIDAPVGRDPAHPTRMAVVVGGRPSRSHYRRLADWDGLCLVEVSLETGRTHQIRVHFASIGAPLVGDRVYRSGLAVSADPGRVWLHAAGLVFPHPGDRTELTLQSPLPADLRRSLLDLGAPTNGVVPRW